MSCADLELYGVFLYDLMVPMAVRLSSPRPFPSVATRYESFSSSMNILLNFYVILLFIHNKAFKSVRQWEVVCLCPRYATQDRQRL